MKSALSASLKAEDETVRNRFERAESLLENKFPSSDRLESTSGSEESVSKEQAKKERVIRDSFTLPSGDYELIAALRQRCLKSAVNVNKSEVIRAGLHALNQLSDEDLLYVVDGLAKVKTGRPAEKV
ncbi:hypothetical protein H6G00_15175 [Leptolyngbya sp. FACHB-541]|uniref:hypothetical protein n=1 Tax=Leptolyngbya sp. FACHB-541 TaxID=2692810 RepID=UPI001686CBDA|nr:hypothetical protein [Leptolyngbya sp. FACHB-541]MBD1997952.1 hypothetical protein [Leptolyngbya sp. FACHB-541]